jgi:hypothetical protein
VIVLSDGEYLDRHRQSLGEAHAACQRLGRQVDRDLRSPRGKDYIALKTAVEMLEGSARQLGQLRSDARWIRLAAYYGRVRLKLQPAYMMERWAWFGGLTAVFELGQKHLADLRDGRTGVRSGVPILPANPVWAQHPDYKPVMTRPKVLN